jgi:hypothetical protein
VPDPTYSYRLAQLLARLRMQPQGIRQLPQVIGPPGSTMQQMPPYSSDPYDMPLSELSEFNRHFVTDDWGGIFGSIYDRPTVYDERYSPSIDPDVSEDDWVQRMQRMAEQQMRNQYSPQSRFGPR